MLSKKYVQNNKKKIQEVNNDHSIGLNVTFIITIIIVVI